MIKMGALVQPLINHLSEFINEQSVLHMDETPLQVLNEPNKTAQSKSYMWVIATCVTFGGFLDRTPNGYSRILKMFALANQTFIRSNKTKYSVSSLSAKLPLGSLI
jgi:hypothetical protein